MEKTLKASWDDKCSRTNPDQVAGLCDTASKCSRGPERKEGHCKKAFSRRNQIPKSAFEYIPRTWKPGLKRVPRT